MTDRQLTAALASSAAVAAAVPPGQSTASVPGGRPWRWVVHTGSLDLFADRGRVVTSMDVTDRLTLITCGEALYRARIALAADGLAARVTLLPDADPDHIATVTAPERIGVTDEARARYRAAGHRLADRRTLAPSRAPDEALAALAAAARDEGLRLHLLSREHVVALAAATAVTRRARDRIWQDEATVYGVLAGDGDEAPEWVRAGEALSAMWLEATRRGLSIVASTAVVEIPASRKVLQRFMPDLVTPYLALRIGVRTGEPP